MNSLDLDLVIGESISISVTIYNELGFDLEVGLDPLIATSRQPAFGELPLLWRTVTIFSRWQFYDGASTITILVDIIMLGQCKLLFIASDMVGD